MVQVDYERRTLFRFLDFMTGTFREAFTGTEENKNIFICFRHDHAILLAFPTILGLAQQLFPFPPPSFPKVKRKEMEKK